jgi:phosphate starvation-inducible protein PhoH and related proteins
MSENRKINPKNIKINKDQLKVTLRGSQQEYVRKILNSDITFCQGPAGTSKTFTACYAALSLLADKKIKNIVLCKPIQEAGEKLGFLPGDVQEKINPYMESYITNMGKIVGIEATQKLIDAGVVQFKPLAFMRGDTYDDALMVLDEAQNSSFKQIMLFVTRMGESSKVIVTGDVSQYDIAKKDIGLESFINLMEGINGVASHKFTDKDIVRAKILKDIVKRYEKWKLDNEN